MAHLYARHDHGGMDMDSGSTAMMGMKAYFHATIPSTDYLWFQSWVPSSVGAVIGACIGVFLLAVGERALCAVQRAAEGEWRRSALRRLSSPPDAPSTNSSSSSSYKQPGSQEDTIPAYNPSRSHTSSTLEKRFPSGSEDPEIVPVLPSEDVTSASGATATPPARSPSATTGRSAEQTYLPRALVTALTDRARKNRYSVPFIWSNDLTRGLLMFCTKGLQYLLMLVVMTFNLWFVTAVCLGAGVGEALFGRHGH